MVVAQLADEACPGVLLAFFMIAMLEVERWLLAVLGFDGGNSSFFRVMAKMLEVGWAAWVGGLEIETTAAAACCWPRGGLPTITCLLGLLAAAEVVVGCFGKSSGGVLWVTRDIGTAVEVESVPVEGFCGPLMLTAPSLNQFFLRKSHRSMIIKRIREDGRIFSTPFTSAMAAILSRIETKSTYAEAKSYKIYTI